MRKHILFFIVFSVFIIHSTELYPADPENHELEQYIHNIRYPGSPKIVSDFLVFSQAPVQYTRYIGICFDHENYREIHVFKKNRHGIFFFAYPLESIPEELTSLTYRLVADGLWMADPMVEEIIKDKRGVRLSVLDIGKRERTINHETSAIGDGIIEFFVNAEPGKDVFVIGDFNHWNPFSHRMYEKSKGLYTTKVAMSPGIHTYTYVIDGELIDVTQVETRPEFRVFVHSLGTRALIIRAE